MKKWWMAILITGVIGLSACGADETGKTEEKKNEEESEQQSNGENEEKKNEKESAQQNNEGNEEKKTSDESNGQVLAEQLAVKSSAETSGKKADISFSLTNEGEEAVEAGFLSGQQFDVRVTDQKGENVYTFSADRSFTQAKTSENIEAGQKLENAVEWKENVTPGEYEATVTFLVNTVNGDKVKDMEFTSTSAFTIEKQKESSSEESGSAEGEGTEQGTEEEGDPEPSEPSSSVEGNDAFRNLELSGEKGNYTVSGEARVFEGDFLYRVEDGHNELISETTVQVDAGAPNWSQFELAISIPESELPASGAITLMIYDRNAKDNEPVNVNYVPLDRFGEE